MRHGNRTGVVRAGTVGGLLLVAVLAAACTTTLPTPSARPGPTAMPTPAPTPAPTLTGPGWAVAAAARWAPTSPQWNALAHPDDPYSPGGAALGNPGSITFTATLARKWWDAWFAAPVDLRDVNTGLQPGNLVLSPDELKKARDLLASGTLPPASADYNPLGLPVIP